MKINYWDCQHHDYEEHWDGQEETRIYGCAHPANQEHLCSLSNKYADGKDDCVLLDVLEKHDIQKGHK